MINRYNIVFTILISINGLVSFGQLPDLILTKEQNDKWLDSLKTLCHDKQINYIKTRILNDTIVYNSNQYRSDRVILENVKKEDMLKGFGNIAEGRILYFVRYMSAPNKKYKLLAFEWNNWTSTTEIKKFHSFLTVDKIKNIEFNTYDSNELVIYDSIAEFGVIVFDLNKRKYLKEFNKMKDK